MSRRLGPPWSAFIALMSGAMAARGAEPLMPSVADAYQRCIFMLQLNPVVWEAVAADGNAIAAQVRAHDPEAADSLAFILSHAASASQPAPLAPPDSDEPIGFECVELRASPGYELARQVFVPLTKATAKLAQRRIMAVAAVTQDRTKALAQARDALYAFEPFLRVFDPLGWRSLENTWGEIVSATATEPSGGGRENDADRLVALCSSISKYMTDNFGAGFSAAGEGPFFPVPLGSPTADRAGKMPIALPPGSRINKPLPRPNQLLNSVERGAVEREMPLSSLGAAGFNNPYILGEPAQSLGISCNTCHNKSGINPTFFIPGLSAREGGVDVTNSFFSPHANNAIFDPLDIPDLRGIRFTAPYGRNGRLASLREFVRNVLVNEFNGKEPDPVLLDAMIIYMNEFDFLPNPALARDGTLNHRASENARRGEKHFNRPFPQFGNRSCASCHIPGANFLDHQRHDIGTVNGSAEFSRDRALDTPTLLGTAVTAPYFHDGSQPTLRAVIEWFDREYRLRLSDEELADLTSYVSTVGNGIRAFQPGENFIEEDLEDQESALAAFEYLAERGKWSVLGDTFRGIEHELRQQVGAVNGEAAQATLTALADHMRDALNAAASGQLETARDAVHRWRSLYKVERHELR